MENLILLLLSVESINLTAQDSVIVFSKYEYKQEFPHIETEVPYLESFSLTFTFNAFQVLTCTYRYKVDVSNAKITCFDSRPQYNIHPESFVHYGFFTLSAKDFDCLSSCVPDWTPFIERIRSAHFKNNLLPRLQVLVTDFLKSHESKIKHELDVINNEMF